MGPRVAFNSAGCRLVRTAVLAWMARMRTHTAGSLCVGVNWCSLRIKGTGRARHKPLTPDPNGVSG